MAALANPDLRHQYSQYTGYSEDALADQAVTDPTATLPVDVQKLLNAPKQQG